MLPPCMPRRRGPYLAKSDFSTQHIYLVLYPPTSASCPLNIYFFNKSLQNGLKGHILRMKMKPFLQATAWSWGEDPGQLGPGSPNSVFELSQDPDAPGRLQGQVWGPVYSCLRSNLGAQTADLPKTAWRSLCRGEIRNSVTWCAKGRLMNKICNILILM